MSKKKLLLIYFNAAFTVSFQWFKPLSTMNSIPSEIIRYFQYIYPVTKLYNVMATIIPIYCGPNLLLAFNTSLPCITLPWMYVWGCHGHFQAFHLEIWICSVLEL